MIDAYIRGSRHEKKWINCQWLGVWGTAKLWLEFLIRTSKIHHAMESGDGGWGAGERGLQRHIPPSVLFSLLLLAKLSRRGHGKLSVSYWPKEWNFKRSVKWSGCILRLNNFLRAMPRSMSLKYNSDLFKPDHDHKTDFFPTNPSTFYYYLFFLPPFLSFVLTSSFLNFLSFPAYFSVFSFLSTYHYTFLPSILTKYLQRKIIS